MSDFDDFFGFFLSSFPLWDSDIMKKNIDIVPDKEGFSVFGGIRITILPHTEETHKFNRTGLRRHVAELPNWDLEPHCLLPFLL